MALTQLGSAADAAADNAADAAADNAAADGATPVADTLRRRAILLPQQRTRHPDDDTLLAAVRAGLAPGDPVARLLARWPAGPVRPVASHADRPAPAPHTA